MDRCNPHQLVSGILYWYEPTLVLQSTKQAITYDNFQGERSLQASLMCSVAFGNYVAELHVDPAIWFYCKQTQYKQIEFWFSLT